MKRKQTVKSAFGILVLVLALVGPGVIAWASKVSASGREGDVVQAAPWLCAFIVLIAVVWFLGVHAAGRTSQSVGLVWPPTKMTFLVAAALTAFFVLIYGPLIYQMLTRLGSGAFEQGQASLASLPTWYLVLAIIVVAGGEEWLYRGFAIPVLEDLTGNTWLAAAISLLAFGLVHMPLWGIGASLSTLVAGAVFTAFFLWRRDVTSLIAAHIAVDLYGLVVAPMLARTS